MAPAVVGYLASYMHDAVTAMHLAGEFVVLWISELLLVTAGHSVLCWP